MATNCKIENGSERKKKHRRPSKEYRASCSGNHNKIISLSVKPHSFTLFQRAGALYWEKLCDSCYLQLKHSCIVIMTNSPERRSTCLSGLVLCMAIDLLKSADEFATPHTGSICLQQLNLISYTLDYLFIICGLKKSFPLKELSSYVKEFFG